MSLSLTDLGSGYAAICEAQNSTIAALTREAEAQKLVAQAERERAAVQLELADEKLRYAQLEKDVTRMVEEKKTQIALNRVAELELQNEKSSETHNACKRKITQPNEAYMLNKKSKKDLQKMARKQGIDPNQYKIQLVAALAATAMSSSPFEIDDID